MTVAAILKHKGNKVVTVEPTARITEVITALDAERIGAVLVLDRVDQLLGVVSERDCCRDRQKGSRRSDNQTFLHGSDSVF